MAIDANTLLKTRQWTSAARDTSDMRRWLRKLWLYPTILCYWRFLKINNTSTCFHFMKTASADQGQKVLSPLPPMWSKVNVVQRWIVIRMLFGLKLRYIYRFRYAKRRLEAPHDARRLDQFDPFDTTPQTLRTALSAVLPNSWSSDR